MQNGLQEEFMEWAAAEQAAGNITFAVKLAAEASPAVHGDQTGLQQLLRNAVAAVQRVTALL